MVEHGFYFAIGVMLAVGLLMALATVLAFCLGMLKEYVLIPLVCLIAGHDLPNDRWEVQRCDRCRDRVLLATGKRCKD